MGRSPCCEKVGLKKGRWTSEEDEILTNYIQANGEGSWRSLPKNAGLLRCGKSCRLRWMNYLRADLKRGNITAQEEETIVKLHAALGNKWSLIAAQLPGRTDNEIKNYWNSHLRRKIYSFTNTKTKPSLHDIDAIATTTAEAAEGQSKQSHGIASSSTADETGEVLGPSAVQIQGVEPCGSSASGENGMAKQVVITDQHNDDDDDDDDDEKDVDGDQNDDRERSSIAEMTMSSGGERQELEVDYWENYDGAFYDDHWRLSDDSDEVFCWLFDGNNADEAGSTPD